MITQMRTRGLALFLVAGCVSAVLAQRPIQWRVNVNQAVAAARQAQRPLLFYLPGDDDFDESDLEDAQEEVFRDPVVRGFVAERFIPVKLAHSSTTRQLLKELGVTVGYGLFLLVATPDGELVGRIQPHSVARKSRALKQMAQLFNTYREELYDEELEELLTKRKLDLREVRGALQLIREFLITKADETVAELLKRSRVSRGLRRDVYQTLAALSTGSSVETLVRAARDDEQARRALRQCTPAGAEHMLPLLVKEDGTVRRYVYDAIARICDFEDPKPERFWKNAEGAVQQQALADTRSKVERIAQAWRKKFAALR